jgi:hypothetical protein
MHFFILSGLAGMEIMRNAVYQIAMILPLRSGRSLLYLCNFMHFRNVHRMEFLTNKNEGQDFF